MSTLDESTAGMLQGWDGGFAPELAGAGVRVDLLPEAVACTAVIGEVTPEAAAATGIPAGTPVAAGGIDSVGAALEAGVLGPEDAPAEMTGFSTVAMRAVPRGTHVPGLIHTRHCFPDVDLVLAAQNSTGSAVDWLRRITGVDPARSGVLPRTRPGRLLLVPSFAGDRTPTWSTRSRAAIVGLDLACEPGDLLLALFEATAMALRECLEKMFSDDASPRSLRCIGGGANSADWLQIKADVLGRPVEVPEGGHGAAVGAGLLAGLAVGHFTGTGPLRRRAEPARTRLLPEPDRHRAYTRRLPRFLALRDEIEPYATELVNDDESEQQ